MRFSLSHKILVVYSLLLSFSLTQGIILYSVIDEFRTNNAHNELITEFKFQVHALEDLKDKVSFKAYHQHEYESDLNQSEHQHESFDKEFTETRDILKQLLQSKGKQISKFTSQLNDAGFFLANYRRAYFELHELIHKELLIHEQGVRTFSQIRGNFSLMGPEASEKLFALLLDNYTLESNIFKNHDISALPKIKEFKDVITSFTHDQKTLNAALQNVIELTEQDYLNSLAIRDRQEFLADSSSHLSTFCDSVSTSLAEYIHRYQIRLKWYMTILVATAILITLLLFWQSRKYFHRFLNSQQKAINSIGKGNYDYQLPLLPNDELGDLAIFLRGMADSLQKSEKIALQSEQRTRLLLDSTAEAIYGLDKEGRCTFCNTSFLRNLGYKNRKEILGKNIHELIHHTRIDGSVYPWEECVAHRGFLNGKETYSDDEIFWRSDGSSFYAECWSHPIEENGEIIGAVVTFFDISKRKKALQDLRNSEELYRTLIENIDLGITLIDNNHTVIMTNSAQAQFFERTPVSFVGQKCFQEFEKKNKVCSHCPGTKAMDTGKPQETVTEGVKDDGSTFSVRIKAFPVFREEDEVFGFIEVVEDISDRLQAEQNLATEKERLAVTLRSIGDGVITTDIEGRVVLINRIAEQLCGWSQGEAQGKPLTEVFQIINEKTGSPCENPVDKVLATGQTIALAIHTSLIHRDGTQRSIADSGAPIRDRENNIIGVVVVFRDVTEENIREQELLKAKKLESIGLLAGGIAHDFNNILSAILGNINLIRHIIQPGERKTHMYLEEAEKASKRAQNLTRQLLTFSKGGEPVIRTASLTDIIQDSTAFVLRGTDIKYEYDIPSDIWQVEVDPGQISQVIQNIVLNARHAMPTGGVLLINCSNIMPDEKTPVVLPENKKYVVVNITDSGIGIPENIIENIFDPYFSTKSEGSGLGLSICHSIIKKHNGFISVQSQQAVGTTFTLHLPASSDPIVEEEAEHEEKTFEQHGLTVLIMDDDEQIRSVAEAMLLHLGCKILQAEDGEEATKLYHSAMETGEPIDVIIMDLTIPGGMGGEEAVSEILKLDSNAKVIVSSGYSNDPIMAKHKEYGFKAAVIKPYRLKELAQALEKAMSP